MVARLPAGSLPAPPARGTEGHGLFPGAHPVRSEALPRGRALSQMKSLSARLVFSPRARPSGSSFPLRVPPSVSSCPLRPAAVSHRAHSPLQGCVNLCCNASTCTLKPDAVCAHGLCCQDCQVSVLGPRPAPGSAGSSLGQATGHLGCENGGPDRTSWCPPTTSSHRHPGTHEGYISWDELFISGAKATQPEKLGLRVKCACCAIGGA